MPTTYDGPAADLKYEFRVWAKEHKNFMTPRIVSLYAVPEDGVVIEVAEGTDFGTWNRAHGVTPWRRVGEYKFEQAGMREHRQLFQGPDSKATAVRFAKELKKWFEGETKKRRVKEDPFPELRREARFGGRRPVPVRRHRRVK